MKRRRGSGSLLTVLLLAAAPVSLHAQSTFAQGRVVDGAGVPIAGVLVYLAGAEESATRTGSDGGFLLDDVTPRSYAVLFRHDAFAPHDLAINLSDRGGTVGEITLLPGTAPTATVLGSVAAEEGGAPLDNAEVEINGGATVLTDELGRFELVDVPVRYGPNRLAVRHLAFADTPGEVWVSNPGDTVRVSVGLASSPLELPGVVVEGAAPVLALPVGFAERRNSTNGYFLDRIEIEAKNPPGMTQLLRTVPGIQVRPAVEGTDITFTRRTRSLRLGGAGSALSLPDACRSPVVYLDGVLVENDTGSHVDLDDLVGMDDLAALEVYNGASRIPTEFNTMGSGCGVLALWTIHARTAQVSARQLAASRAAAQVGGMSTRRKVVIGAIAVPAAILILRSAVCSLPHYCR